MAEEEASDDIAVDKEGQDKILGLPKKIFIIVVAVLIVLIIAVTAYFLLAGKDKEQANPQQAIQDQTSTTGDNLINPANTNGQATTQQNQTDKNDELRTQVFELREQVIQLKEENLILKKQIFDLETKQPQAKASNNTVEQPRKNPYDTEIKDFPPIEPYVPVEKPKPKFG